MKRLTKLLPLLLAFFLVTQVALAQESFNATKAYEDYLFNYNNYQESEENYQLKRSEYLRFNTLSSKEEAVIATRAFLKDRDNVTSAYSTAVRMTLLETPGIPEGEKGSKLAILDEEIKWFNNHTNTLDSSADLNSLVSKSKEAEERYSKTELVIYNTLFDIGVGRLNDKKDKINRLIGNTNSQIEKIKQSGDKETILVEKWVKDAQLEISASEEKIYLAKEEISDMQERDKTGKKRGRYLTSLGMLNQSQDHLEKASNALNEIILEIKTAD